MTTTPQALRPVPLPYPEGSGHTVLHRLIAEALEELDLRNSAIGVCGVGESFLMYDFFNLDFASAPPGRAVSVATGVKRAQPQAAVFAYQGDGDAFGAGLGDLLHAVARNEPITVFVLNNGTLGLSGGHLSPTTAPSQRTRTTPEGRAVAAHGTPIRGCEVIAALGTAARVERVAVDTPEHVEAARTAVREAFRHAHEGRGTAVLEVLAASTAEWDSKDQDRAAQVGGLMIPAFPLGRFGGKA
jgi:2-oxoglutarate ferredoxin oxidoreductase subunit beta